MKKENNSLIVTGDESLIYICNQILNNVLIASRRGKAVIGVKIMRDGKPMNITDIVGAKNSSMLSVIGKISCVELVTKKSGTLKLTREGNNLLLENNIVAEEVDQSITGEVYVGEVEGYQDTARSKETLEDLYGTSLGEFIPVSASTKGVKITKNQIKDNSILQIDFNSGTLDENAIKERVYKVINELLQMLSFE